MKKQGVLQKLSLLVAISVIAFCAVGVFGIVSNKKIYDSVDRVRKTASMFQRGALNLTDPLNELRQLTLTMVMAPNLELQQDVNEQQRKLSEKLEQSFDGWDLSEASPSEREAFESLRASWKDYREIKDATVKKVLGGYREEAFINAIQAEHQQFQIVNDQVNNWQKTIIEEADEVNRSAEELSRDASWVFTVTIFAATLLIGGFGFITTRMIIGPIVALKNTAANIAGRASLAEIGEALDERIEVRSDDEIGALADAFNKMVENLRLSMEKLEIAEKRTQSILNSTADGILTVDANGIVRSLNASAETLLKYRESEIRGHSITKIVPSFNSSGLDRLASSRRSDASTQIGLENEAYGLDKQGRRVPIALRVTEIEFSGEVLYIATLQNIARRKQAEEERARLFEAIQETVNHLSVASSEISATMQQQSAGTEKQASAVSQTVAAVDEAARTAHESMHLANDVAETARRADDVGRSGRKAIEATRVSMNNVRERVESTADSIMMLVERAEAIGEIIKTVNDIAEQTNLLALNAAIEASRAGEAGKGFSVVADEVKSLAQQAKKSTAQIRGILAEIQDATKNAKLATEQGTESVGDANLVVVQAERTIEELGTMVGEAARAAARIVAASSQQAQSMGLITESMNEIDQTAKQTLAATQQTTRAANDLSTLGTRLSELLASNERVKLGTAVHP